MFFEERFEVERSLDDYLLAWKSVRNPYWDLATPEGNALFEIICGDIRREVGCQTLSIRYSTRCWTARLANNESTARQA